MNLLGKLTCFKTSLPFAWEVKYFQIFFWRVVCFYCLVHHTFFWARVSRWFKNSSGYLFVMVLKKCLWHLHEEPNFFEEFVFIASFIILHGLILKNCHDISTYLPSHLTYKNTQPIFVFHHWVTTIIHTYLLLNL